MLALDSLASVVENCEGAGKEERCSALSKECAGKVCDKALEVLVEQLKGEANQENVAILVHAIARWCVAGETEELPKEALEVMLKSCFVEVEKRSSVLHGIEILCGASTKLSKQVATVALVMQCVEKESTKKREEKVTTKKDKGAVKKDKGKKGKAVKKSKKSDLSELELEVAKPKGKAKTKSKSGPGSENGQVQINFVELLCRTISSSEFQKQPDSVLTSASAFGILSVLRAVEEEKVSAIADKQGLKLLSFAPKKAAIVKAAHFLGNLKREELQIRSTDRFDERTRGRFLQEKVMLVLARSVSSLLQSTAKDGIVTDEGFAYLFVYVLYYQHLLSRSGLASLVGLFPPTCLLDALQRVMVEVESDAFVRGCDKRSTAYHRTLLTLISNGTDKDFGLLLLLAHHPWARRKTTWKVVALGKLPEQRLDSLSQYLLEASKTNSEMVGIRG